MKPSSFSKGEPLADNVGSDAAKAVKSQSSMSRQMAGQGPTCRRSFTQAQTPGVRCDISHFLPIVPSLPAQIQPTIPASPILSTWILLSPFPLPLGLL